jgi:hypothetical protein
MGTPTQFVGSTHMIPNLEQRTTAETRKATLALGLMGATVGLALGAAGGLAQRSARASVAAAFLGLVLGAVAGAGTAQMAVPLASHVHESDPGSMTAEMAASLLVHGLPWAVIGAVGGLVFGIGLGGRAHTARSFIGGTMGAIAGAILYEITGALALPDSKIIDPIAATWGVRLLAQLVAVIALSTGIAALAPYPTGARRL